MSSSPIEVFHQCLAVSGFLLWIAIVVLTYQRRLGENYAMLWFAFGFIALVGGIWGDWLRSIATTLDAATVAPLLILGTFSLTVIAISYAVRLSEHDRKLQRLAQALALLGAESDLDEKDGDAVR